MRTSRSVSYALGALVAVALVTACSGLAEPNAMYSSAGVGVARQASWIKLSDTALLYVSNPGNNTVTAYSWRSGELLAALNGFNLPHGLCVDSANNVYVTDWGSGQIFEYRHGNLILIKTLSDPLRTPNGCSVDPTTGNLAVTDDSGVLVYADASGSPTQYTNSNFRSYLFTGYDPSGNLFVDGVGRSTSVFAELPKGGSTLGSLSLDKTIISPSGLQWDGRYLAICEQGNSPNQIYAFAITGSTGTLKSTTTLVGSSTIEEFWIPNNGKLRGTTIVAANYHGAVRYWKYPAGGKSTLTVTSHVSQPIGVTVSK